MFLPVIVNQNVVLDSWSTVIEDGAGRGGEIFRLVENFIVDHKVPAVKTKRQRMAHSYLGWLLGDSQECLTVVNTIDGDLNTFAVHLTTMDFGSSLSAAYFLCTRLGLLRALVERAGYWLDQQAVRKPLAVELNVLQRELLMKSFTTVVFTALQTAVQQVMQGLGGDGDLNSQAGFRI